MSLEHGENHKYSGLKVNISHDTNARRLISSENPLRPTVSHEDVVIRNAMNSANDELKIDRFNDDPLESETKQKYRLPAFVGGGKLTVPKENPRERLGVETIFPNVCLYYLNGQCVESDCPNSHKYPQQKHVYMKLQSIGCQDAGKLFRAIVSRCRGLLINYFVVFARYFAGKRQTALLIDMIAVCEHPQNKMIPYFGKLIKAFLLSGLEYDQTIAVILKNHRRKTKATLANIFNTEIVPDVTITDIRKALELLIADPEYDFDVLTINYLMNMSCKVGTIAFLTTMYKIFDRVRGSGSSIMNGIDVNQFKRFMNIYENCTKKATATSERRRICAP